MPLLTSTLRRDRHQLLTSTLCLLISLLNLHGKSVTTLGSDHWPIIVREVHAAAAPREARYLLDKADWKLFESLTRVAIDDNELATLSVDHFIVQYNRYITQAADLSIPKSSCLPRPQTVPWWNAECSAVIVDRKKCLRRYQRSHAVPDRISYNRAQTRAKYIMHQARVTFWSRYVSTLNVHSPMAQISSRVKKISGIYQVLKKPFLKHNGAIVSDPAEVSELFSSLYEFVSSRQLRSPQFLRYAWRQEAQELSFDTDEAFQYNSPLAMLELQQCLSSSGNSAPGPDAIHYKMISRSHITVQQSL